MKTELVTEVRRNGTCWDRSVTCHTELHRVFGCAHDLRDDEARRYVLGEDHRLSWFVNNIKIHGEIKA